MLYQKQKRIPKNDGYELNFVDKNSSELHDQYSVCVLYLYLIIYKQKGCSTALIETGHPNEKVNNLNSLIQISTYMAACNRVTTFLSSLNAYFFKVTIVIKMKCTRIQPMQYTMIHMTLCNCLIIQYIR